VQQILHALQAADLLQNRGKLRRTIETCFRLVFEEGTASQLLQALQGPGRIPSAATLSRRQLQVHAGWLEYVRQQNSGLLRGGIAWTLLADSSPQGGREWLNLTGRFMAAGELGAMLLHAHVVIGCGNEMPELLPAREADEVASMSALSAALKTPYLPATTLGSKRASMPHKMAAILHALRLVLPSWDAVCAALTGLVAVTSDLGTERLLVSFPKVPLSAIVPWATEDGLPAEPTSSESESTGERGSSCDHACPASDGPEFELEPDLPARPDADDTPQGAHPASGLDFAFEGDGTPVPDPLLQEEPSLSSPPAEAALPPSPAPADTAPQVLQGLPEECGQQAPLTVDVTSALYVPGALHVLHNATNDLAQSLVWWSQYVAGLTLLCRLLRGHFLRQRLVATCFAAPPASHLAGLFENDSFNDLSVQPGRWGSIALATSKLAKFEGPLRTFWHAERFNYGETVGPRATGDCGHLLSVGELDATICAPMFWSYRKMAEKVCAALEHGMHWIESCPCHHRRFPLGTTAADRKQFFRDRYGIRACPLQGCRAPDFANGRFMQVFERLMSEHLAIVEIECDARLNAADRQVVLGDFVKARAHLRFVMTLKFSTWQQLPLKMAGIADSDLSQARATAASCLALYEAAAPQHGALHPLCHVLMGRETHLRHELLQFVRGTPLAELPALCCFLGRFKFICTSERAVEAMHAEVLKSTRRSPHHSPMYVAVRQCLPFLQRELEAKPRTLGAIAQCCQQVRTPLQAAHRLGFAKHPGIAGGPRARTRDRRAAAIMEVLCHADAPTLTQTFDLPRGSGEVVGGAEAVTASAPPMDLLAHYAVLEARDRLAKDPGGVFRLDLACLRPGGALTTLEDIVAPGHTHTAPVPSADAPSPDDEARPMQFLPDEGAIMSDFLAGALASKALEDFPTLRNHVFFQVVRAGMPRMQPTRRRRCRHLRKALCLGALWL
jgi:hypothetical protein